MLQPRKVLVIVRHTQCRYHPITKRLQLFSIHDIRLRREDLHGHANGLDLRLLQVRRVRRRDGVNEGVRLGPEAEDGPATVAEADGADAFMLRAEGVGGLGNLRLADLLAVAGYEGRDVDLRPAAFVEDELRGYDLAAKTTRRRALVPRVCERTWGQWE